MTEHFFLYLEMSTGYNKKTKKDVKKRLVKGIKMFVKNKKTKSENMIVNVKKGFSKEEKVKKRQYECERYKNQSEGKKDQLNTKINILQRKKIKTRQQFFWINI